MSTIAEKVPDIELHIPGGKKESKNKGTNIGTSSILRTFLGSCYTTFLWPALGTWLYLTVREPGRCSVYLGIYL